MTLEQRETIFRMRDVDGKTFREIAKALGFSSPYVINTYNHSGDPVWEEKWRESGRETARKKREQNKEAARAYARKRYQIEKPLRRQWNVNKNRDLKDRVYQQYGGYECVCCGETEKAILQIDHIEGGGNQHRKKLNGKCFYRWLWKNGFPPGYQILCANCNWGKRYTGVCPHELKRMQEEMRVSELSDTSVPQTPSHVQASFHSAAVLQAPRGHHDLQHQRGRA